MIDVEMSSTSSEPVACIMAGGKATRLKAAGIELSKALITVSGAPLIAYILDDCIRSEIDTFRIAIAPSDEALHSWLVRFAHTFEVTVEVLHLEPKGTLDAVLNLLNGVDNSVILSTCDVVAMPGAVDRVLSGAEMATGPDMVLAVTRHVADSDPIWVECADPPSLVTNVGKTIAPSEWVFGHIRWLSRSAIAQIDGVLVESDVERDSDLLGILTGQLNRGCLAIDCGDLNDVDEVSDIHDVERLISQWGVRLTNKWQGV